MSLNNRPKWSKQKPKTNLNKPSLPNEYEPRSPLVKAFPAIVIMGAVLVFVVVHFVAHHNTEQYDIEAINPLKTRLTFQVDYEITTNINAYAGFWGEWVMDEFSTDVLAFYQRKLS